MAWVYLGDAEVVYLGGGGGPYGGLFWGEAGWWCGQGHSHPRWSSSVAPSSCQPVQSGGRGLRQGGRGSSTAVNHALPWWRVTVAGWRRSLRQYQARRALGPCVMGWP